jgi:hypothetical protein
MCAKNKGNARLMAPENPCDKNENHAGLGDEETHEDEIAQLQTLGNTPSA